MKKKSNSVIAIIPVRELADTKLRLSPFLNGPQRARLSLSMLRQVVREIYESKIEKILIVCSKREKQLLLIRKDFPDKLRIIKESRHHGGVNRAVEDGINYSTDRYGPVERFIVIPSDLPLLTSGSLNYAIRQGERFDLVITPSFKRDGTNLLLFNLLRSSIPLHYDDDSYKKHLSEAKRKGLSYLILRRHDLSFDLDSKEEFERLRALMNAHSFDELIQAIERGKC